MKCHICNSQYLKIVYEKYPSYIDSVYFDIYRCEKCSTHTINPEEVDDNIYDIIYQSSENLSGYDRYLEYARKMKSLDHPLSFLAKSEEPYHILNSYLKENYSNQKLNILEVGCGFGYLTYSLNKEKHKAFGIDISANAINFAKKHFGNYYMSSQIQDFNPKLKYDLIIATEVIEHVPYPQIFINQLVDLLKSDGKIFLTTPNKQFSNNKSVWFTDLPPVHIYWFDSKSIYYLCKTLNLKYQILFNDMCTISKNRILELFLTKFANIDQRQPKFSKDGNLIRFDKNKTSAGKFRELMHSKVIKSISNKIYKPNLHPILGFVISK